MNETVAIDDLTFDLRYSARRRTIGITVERDGSLVLDAPERSSPAAIEAAARRKRGWVYKKLAQQAMLARPGRAREFVSGEGFEYLGRGYRLQLVTPEPGAMIPPLRLHHSRFLLHREAVPAARRHFISWYVAHGKPWIARRVEQVAGRIGVAPAAVEVRDLGYRWGSCSQSNTLNFHWRAVLLPPSIVEYIIAHELVHLREPRHDQDFWLRLRRVMPDYNARKAWLAEHGGRYDL